MQADSFEREENVQKHARSPIRRLARAAAILALAVAPHLALADSWTDANGFTWSYSVDNGDATITGVSPAEGDITLPASIGNNRVSRIGDGAFSGCSGLRSVTILDSVKRIGNNAFRDCSGLTSVTIPDSVTSIGNYAFEGCSGLTRVTIGNGVTSIGYGAFRGCSGLTGVTIPDSVTSIGESAFEDCSGLTSVTIPASVTSIGDWVFFGCSGLTGVTIPTGVRSIGVGAFCCSGLTSVTIPASVTSIGYDAFGDCSGLTCVTFDGDAPTVDMEGAFNGVSAACVVRLPRNNATYEVTDGTWQGMTVEWQPTFSVGGKGTIAESGDGRYVVTANEGVALTESDFAFPGTRKAYRVEIASGGATAVVALKAPFEVERSGAVADGPWTEDDEGSVTLNVEIVPGLYYAAASAASLDGLVCPGASAPATAETRLVVRKPVGSPSGFFKVWVSERPLAAGGK